MRVSVCLSVCLCACVHVCMCACVHVCMCACVYVCMCECVLMSVGERLGAYVEHLWVYLERLSVWV